MTASNEPSTQRLLIRTEDPGQYAVRVRDGEPIPVGADGQVEVEVPALGRVCQTRVLGVVPVNGFRTAEDVKAIEIVRRDKVVRRLSLSRIERLPQEDAYRVIELR
jgi:hypothetical protein